MASSKMNEKAGKNKAANAVTKNAGKAVTGKAVTGKAVTGKAVAGKAVATKAVAAKAVAEQSSSKSKKTAEGNARAKSSDKGSKRVIKKSSTKATASSKKADNIVRAPKAAKKSVEPSFNLVSRDIAQQEMNLLCQEYPEADCELDYSSAFQLLTAVIMSAQTTDVTVNKVTPALFERFPDAKALAEADLDEIKEIIKPTGFFNAKANNIQKCAQALVANFGGVVPQTIEELTTLPGVGRKTANVVLGVIFGVPGWTVDTHVQRLSARLGFTKNTEPEKIEVDLQKLFPGQDWSKLSITLIWHGRRMCFARKPDCPRCPVNNICPSSMV